MDNASASGAGACGFDPQTGHTSALRVGYGTDFDFRIVRAPFAATRSFFIQITQTKLYEVV